MTDNEKTLLGYCIQKYRKELFTQAELAKDICSKYTLSRLENGVLCKSKTYFQLLQKLDLFYEDNFDIIIVDILFKDILSSIIVNNVQTTIIKINQLEEFLRKYQKHVYFLEINIFFSYLKTHYIQKEKIYFEFDELSILPCFNKSIRLCIKHTLCENMLFYNENTKMETFMNTFDMKGENHILTNFFLMVNYQYHALILKSHSLFENHAITFKEDNNDYQNIRFHLVYALGFLNKNKEIALPLLEDTKQLVEKSEIFSTYFFLYYYANMIFHSRRNDFEKAYSYALDAIYKYPKQYAHFLPHLIILALLLNTKIDKKHLHSTNDILSNACIQLYHFTYTNPITPRDRLIFINRYLTKYIGKDNMLLPLVSTLRKLVIDLVDESHCYRSGLVYDAMIKKYTNEKEFLS